MGHNRRYGDRLSALDPPAVTPPPRIRPQHVWVNLSTVQHAPAIYPGVLVEWRPVVKGWEALCTWASPEIDGSVRERGVGHLLIWRGADVEGSLGEGGPGRLVRR